MTQSHVVALFADRDAAEGAIRALQAAGFPRDGIGVALRAEAAADDASSGGVPDPVAGAAEGAAVGAVSGGLFGGVLGLLVGVGALAIPGVGPVIAGGALATVLGVTAGTAAAGAGLGVAAGGILGALIGLGVPEEEARHFEAGLRRGGALVTLEAGAHAAEARSLLAAHGGDLGPGRGGAGGAGGHAHGTVAEVAEPWATAVEPWGVPAERRRGGRRGRRRTDFDDPGH
ncbi:MAG TPA: hypothetical protein VFS40_06690 [Gemmatimonadales bacterium]|nr:hypothetical protein [Gemmatimonadales bacterium]